MQYGSIGLIFLLQSFFLFASCAGSHGEKLFVETLTQYLTVEPGTVKKMYAQITHDCVSQKGIIHQTERPFFKKYPLLQQHVPLVELTDLPTPITKAKKLSAHLQKATIYIKRDDMSGKRLPDGSRLFGGNKMRILEIELARALQEGAQTVMTMGCDGSNLVTAVAAAAQHVGLRMEGILKPQPNAHVVQRNLLLMDAYGAHLTCSTSPQNRADNAIAMFNTIQQDTGRFPYFIPIGASTPYGIIGFINAAFELKQQIDKGIMPEPDRIYVAAGQTVGTYVGLLIGARLVGLRSHIIAVAVEPDSTGKLYAREIKSLFTKTVALLQSLDPSFPLLTFNAQDVYVNHSACGKKYALFTQEAADAIQLLKKTEGIELDGVYAGKAMAALLHDVKHAIKSHETVLFWNTFCGGTVSPAIATRDYKKLPPQLHHYFQTQVQELDCG